MNRGIGKMNCLRFPPSPLLRFIAAYSLLSLALGSILSSGFLINKLCLNYFAFFFGFGTCGTRLCTCLRCCLIHDLCHFVRCLAYTIQCPFHLICILFLKRLFTVCQCILNGLYI